MGIGNWCFGLAAAMAVGTAAEAATVAHKIDFTVTEAFDEYIAEDETEVSYRTPLPGFWGFETGETNRGTLTISECGTRCVLVDLVVAGRSLFSDLGEGSTDDFFAVSDDIDYSWLNLWWTGTSGIFQYDQDRRPYYSFAEANISIAPVPLPAPAMLLPVGS